MFSLPSPLSVIDADTPLSRVPVVRVINFLSILAIFITNALASLLPINGNTTGGISDANPTYITPAGYAFAIWGLIYFGLALWSVYQLLPRTYTSRPINEGVGYLMPFNALFNCAWIVSWHYEQLWLSCILLLHLLATCAVIYARLSKFNPADSWQDWFFIDMGFSLYYAWVLGASFINVYVIGTTMDASFIDAGVTGIVILGVLQFWVAGARMDPLVSGVGCWAITAIAVRENNFAYRADQVYAASVAVAVILGVETLFITLLNAIEIKRNKRESWKIGTIRIVDDRDKI